ncbi:hypothetical protein JYU09_00280 [bacterium AH-315-O15]|nr:hypothetical protein [bacterium AH-315-O15]
MIRRILGAITPVGIAVLVCALAPLLIVQELNAQTALTHPEGLPEWAFNIPDENAAYGPVRVPGSAIRIFSSAENRLRVCRRISRTTFSVDPAFAMGCLLPWQESVSYFTTLRGPH